MSLLPMCVHLIPPSAYSCTPLPVLPGEVALLKISHKLPHLLLHPLLDNLPSPGTSCRGSLHPVMKCRLLFQHIPHGRTNQLSAETEGGYPLISLESSFRMWCKNTFIRI